MIEDILRDIGLSKNEVKIYLALLESGPCRMGQVCARTKIHRRNAYDSIEMLRDKGFVSSTMVNNRNVFEAVNPKRILDILDEKKTDIESILPRLLIKKTEGPSVKVYTGLKGRKVIFEDKLNFPDEQHVLGAHMPSGKISRFIENYHRRRTRKRIPLKMLFTRGEKETARKFRKYKFVQTRILPEKFASPIAINIYGEKVAILLGSGTSEPVSILIENKELSDEFRAYFRMLWEIGS